MHRLILVLVVVLVIVIDLIRGQMEWWSDGGELKVESFQIDYEDEDEDDYEDKNEGENNGKPDCAFDPFHASRITFHVSRFTF